MSSITPSRIEIKEVPGNWNYRDPALPAVLTKPMCQVYFKNTMTWHIFSHDDIFKVLEGYHEVDRKSIKMIRDENINTGDIKNVEMSFISKIEKWCSRIRQRDWAEDIKEYEALKEMEKQNVITTI